jgi:hypothetical protein
MSLTLPGHKDLLQRRLAHLLLRWNIIANRSTSTSILRYVSKDIKKVPKYNLYSD